MKSTATDTQAQTASRALKHTIALSSVKKDGWNVFRLSDDLSVIVVSSDQGIKVISDLCPHMGGPLSQGWMCPKEKTIVCPWHGYRYSTESLALKNNPNEKIWTEPMAGDQAADFKTPAYKLREIPFVIENNSIILNTDRL